MSGEMINRKRELLITLLLIGIVLMGAAFRLYNVNWDEGQYLHPDERHLAMVLNAIALPADLPQYFHTAESPLSPYNRGYDQFFYGTFPLFLTRFVSELIGRGGWGEAHLVGRGLSALFDLGTVIVLFFIGRRLYGVRVGLLASALAALTVLNIQSAHFFAVDTFLTFFILASFYFAVRVAQGGRWWHYGFLGLMIGLATACKISALTFGVVVAAALLLRLFPSAVRSLQSAIAGPPTPTLSHSHNRHILIDLLKTFAGGLLLLVCLLLAFRIAQPYAFQGPGFFDILPNQRFFNDMGAIRGLMNGEVDYPPSHQWTNRTPWLFSLETMVLWSLGVPLGLAACAGWGLALYQLTRRRRWEHLLPLVWVTFTFLYIGAQFVKPIRYFLPIHPFLALLAAFLVVAVWDFAKRQTSNVKRQASDVSRLTFDVSRFTYPALAIALALFVTLGTLAWAWAFIQIYTRPTTRIAASRWIYEHWETAATLHTAEGQPIQLSLRNGTIYAAGDDPAVISFTPKTSVTAVAVTLNHLETVAPYPGPAQFQITLVTDHEGETVLARAEQTVELVSEQTATFPLPATPLAGGQMYYLHTRLVAGPPVRAWGATIGNEHWDDPLPLRVDGKDGFGNLYTGVDLTLYDEDEPAKLVKLLDALDKLDYMCLSSNRLYGSIPRLPMRFPMTTLYYRYLFDGTLGFEPVATFTSHPNLGPIEFDDDGAEEQFTVYDHPKVILLRKTPAYSRARAEALLGNVDWDRIVRLKPIEVPGYKNALLLTDAERVADTLGGTWRDLFDPDGPANRFPEITWYLLLQLLGLVALPFTVVLFRRLDDRGYLFARALGILLLAWLSWLLAYNTALGYTRLTIQIALVILAGSSLLSLLSRALRHDLVGLIRSRWQLILFCEALFLAAFLLFYAIRLGNPDLWHPYMGGEKPMDFAYLNAVIKTTRFPPYDPWFAGGYLNYYYFGQLMLATLIKLAGIVPAVAFNLCIPTLFALTVGGACSVTYNLALPWRGQAGKPAPRRRAWLYGLIGGLLVTVIGNLGQAALLLNGLREVGGGAAGGLTGFQNLLDGLRRVFLEGQSLNFRTEWWYWNATRIIPETINEFPWFSFLYADLHAHLIALPFTLVVLGLLVNLVRSPQSPVPSLQSPVLSPQSSVPSPQSSVPSPRNTQYESRFTFYDFAGVLALAFVLGALRCTNTWDWPTYLLLTLATLGVHGYVSWTQGDPHPRPLSLVWRGGIWGMLRLAVVLLLALDLLGVVKLWENPLSLTTWLFKPFHDHFMQFYARLEPWTGARTALGDYLMVNGIFLFIIVSWLVVLALRRGSLVGGLLRAALRGRSPGRYARLARALSRGRPGWDGLELMGVTAVLIAALALVVADLPVFGVLLPVMVLVGALLLRPDTSSTARLALLMVLLGLGISWGVELVVVAPDIGRMNTVFKFYLQLWVLWGIVSAMGLAMLFQTRGRSRPLAGGGPGWGGDPTLPRPLPTREGWGSTALRTIWTAALVMLLLCGLLYPPTSARAKIEDRFVKTLPTLDGMAYMRGAVWHTVWRTPGQQDIFAPKDHEYAVELVWDYQAIRWLQENVAGSPVVLEATSGDNYRWDSRVSIYTGLPAVVGWDWHQRQQRGDYAPQVSRRIADVYTMYGSTSVPQTLELLRKYRVKYIYVGDLERMYYDPAGLYKLEAMKDVYLDEVYRNPHVVIYQVRDWQP